MSDNIVEKVQLNSLYGKTVESIVTKLYTAQFVLLYMDESGYMRTGLGVECYACTKKDLRAMIRIAAIRYEKALIPYWCYKGVYEI